MGPWKTLRAHAAVLEINILPKTKISKIKLKILTLPEKEQNYEQYQNIHQQCNLHL
jgi:hypothetical protein